MSRLVQKKLQIGGNVITAQLTEIFGEGSLDPEKLVEVSEKIATAIRDSFEQGLQTGLDIRNEQHEAGLRRMHQIEINRLGGWG